MRTLTKQIGWLWLLFLLGCTPEKAPPKKPGIKNLVIIVVDSLRKDSTSLYGFKTHTTPMLEKQAKHALVFENAYTQSSGTEASYVSMMTSTHVRTHGFDFPLDDTFPKTGICGRTDLTFLSEVLQKNGFDTEAFVGSRRLYIKAGFPRGFNRWNLTKTASLPQSRFPVSYMRLKKIPAKTTEKNAIDAMAKWTGDKRHFMYIHIASPTLPYRPGKTAMHMVNAPKMRGYVTASDVDQSRNYNLKENIEKIRKAYLSEIWEADASIYKILFALKKSGHLNHTVVVITGNHGTRYLNPHAVDVGKTLAAVPLLIRVPKQSPKRIDYPVRLIDIAPTVLRWLAIDPAKSWQGKDLMKETRRRVITERLGSTGLRLSKNAQGVIDPEGKWHPLDGAPFNETIQKKLDEEYRKWQQQVPKGTIDKNGSPIGICVEHTRK